VVGLVCFDLRRRGFLKRLALVGTTGKKNAAIREHLKGVAAQYKELDPTIEQYPADDAEFNAESYKAAIDAMKSGDAITVFTPDETHYDISLYAIKKGLHVLVAKPAVMKASEHAVLIKEASERNLVVMVENHKRWDPIYSDARGRIRSYGDMGFFSAFMSQPKTQLETFSKWAGNGSDISFYLNSHHVDFLCWAMQGLAIPISVSAMGSTGIAKVTEDTITLLVQFKNLESGNLGTAVFTSSWVAAKKAEVHSQQRFSYMGHTGEMRVDQAHRGYEVATDENGYASVNPLYMRYTPDASGYFAAQQTYGYRSIEDFCRACIDVNQGKRKAADFDDLLPSIRATYSVTAILEAGRKSLDQGGAPVAVTLDL
jgi:D-galacturonate reductase